LALGSDVTQYKSATNWIIGVIVVIVLLAIAASWYFSHRAGPQIASQGTTASAPRAASTAPPPIAHPISQAQVGPAPALTAALPPLDASGEAAVTALAAIPGAKGLANVLIARGMIPHIVATVDALPSQAIGGNIVPVHTPSGDFMVKTDAQGQPVINPKDYARYARYMRIIKSVDPRALVDWYVHWYPLFQKSYRQLGYPQGYFNDRLLAVIDNLLAAPNARAPVRLKETQNGLYTYADPTWQSLSVGQKLMIRVGPHNERVLKIKLRRIRALLLGEAPMLPGAASAASAAAATSAAAAAPTSGSF
jgi:hypothetical protein